MIELETPQIEPVRGRHVRQVRGRPAAGRLRRHARQCAPPRAPVVARGGGVTSIQIRDVYQEFSTIPGVKEDVTQIVLNVKKLRLKSFATASGPAPADQVGRRRRSPRDIAESADVEIVNPDSCS
jgi:DNA-directed RNA polymerase subunit alpha